MAYHLLPDEEKLTVVIPEINIITQIKIKKFFTVQQVKEILAKIFDKELSQNNFELFIQEFHLNEYYYPLYLSFFFENFVTKKLEIRITSKRLIGESDYCFTNQSSTDLMQEIIKLEKKLKIVSVEENELTTTFNDLSILSKNLKQFSNKMIVNDENRENYFKQAGTINERYLELKIKDTQETKIVTTKKNKVKNLLEKIGEYKKIGR